MHYSGANAPDNDDVGSECGLCSVVRRSKSLIVVQKQFRTKFVGQIRRLLILGKLAIVLPARGQKRMRTPSVYHTQSIHNKCKIHEYPFIRVPIIFSFSLDCLQLKI